MGQYWKIIYQTITGKTRIYRGQFLRKSLAITVESFIRFGFGAVFFNMHLSPIKMGGCRKDSPVLDFKF